MEGKRQCRAVYLGQDTEQKQPEQSLQKSEGKQGSARIDEMTIQAALPWLKAHNHEVTERIQSMSRCSRITTLANVRDKGAKDAIFRIKEYIEQGYTRAVVFDLSKHFETLDYTTLLHLLRKQVKDERVIQMVKQYLKSGVLENGVATMTEEDSPKGGNLPHAVDKRVYLNEINWEFHRRGVPRICYADDIVLLLKSERAA